MIWSGESHDEEPLTNSEQRIRCLTIGPLTVRASSQLSKITITVLKFGFCRRRS